MTWHYNGMRTSMYRMFDKLYNINLCSLSDILRYFIMLFIIFKYILAIFRALLAEMSSFIKHLVKFVVNYCGFANQFTFDDSNRNANVTMS